MFNLIVKEPFGYYSKGQRITDPAEVAAILAGEQEGHVIKVATPSADPAQPSATE